MQLNPGHQRQSGTPAIQSAGRILTSLKADKFDTRQEWRAVPVLPSTEPLTSKQIFRLLRSPQPRDLPVTIAKLAREKPTMIPFDSALDMTKKNGIEPQVQQRLPESDIARLACNTSFTSLFDSPLQSGNPGQSSL